MFLNIISPSVFHLSSYSKHFTTSPCSSAISFSHFFHLSNLNSTQISSIRTSRYYFSFQSSLQRPSYSSDSSGPREQRFKLRYLTKFFSFSFVFTKVFHPLPFISQHFSPSPCFLRHSSLPSHRFTFSSVVSHPYI